MTKRRILVVTYHHPPDRTGGHRWALMGHWLRELGHEVVMIAGAAYGGLADDRAARTHRVGDLASSATLRQLLRRPPLVAREGVGIAADRPLRLLTETVVPDATLATWTPGALRATRRLLREQRFDCVVTTGPPHSTHIIGLLLGKSRPAWIADLRDGWRFEPPRAPWALPGQDRLDAALERRVTSSAEAVIGVTAPIADDIRSRLGVDATYVPNGFDPRWQQDATDASDLPLDSAAFNIVHTGTLSGPWGRDPRALLESLRQIDTKLENRHVQLVLAGRMSIEDEHLIVDAQSGGCPIRHLGLLDRVSALRLQRAADALLLITSANRSEATGKLYEYLAAGRPIIALAQRNEAARIVTETGTGVTVPPDDLEAISEAIAAAASGDLQKRYEPRGLERYLYPGPAEAVAELVERAIARRATT